MENSIISPSKVLNFGINIAKDGIKRNEMQILSQKSVNMSKIREIWPEIRYISNEIDEQLEIKAHYKGYLKKPPNGNAFSISVSLLIIGNVPSIPNLSKKPPVTKE